MKITDLLAPLRNCAGTVRTRGLDDDTVNRLSERFPDLGAAARAAVEQFDAIKAEFGELVESLLPDWGHTAPHSPALM